MTRCKADERYEVRALARNSSTARTHEAAGLEPVAALGEVEKARETRAVGIQL